MGQNNKITALVPAAGSGLRMNLKSLKSLVLVKDKPVIIHTLEVLCAHPLIDEIVLIFNKEELATARDLVKQYKLVKVARVIVGGATRKESVRRGLEVVDTKTKFVLIHDGVRPFVDHASITRVIEAAYQGGAAVCGVPVKSTIKRVGLHHEVEATLKRDQLWEIQTPQVFERELIQEAYFGAAKHAVPDDAALVEIFGKKVQVVLGSYFNIKITTQEDLIFADAIASIKKIEDRKTKDEGRKVIKSRVKVKSSKGYRSQVAGCTSNTKNLIRET